MNEDIAVVSKNLSGAEEPIKKKNEVLFSSDVCVKIKEKKVHTSKPSITNYANKSPIRPRKY